MEKREGENEYDPQTKSSADRRAERVEKVEKAKKTVERRGAEAEPEPPQIEQDGYAGPMEPTGPGPYEWPSDYEKVEGASGPSGPSGP